jgi:hypothetical protein
VGDLLFHNADDGSGAVGRLDPTVCRTQAFPAGAFTVGWTHVVRVGRRLFFYKAPTGEGAVCSLEDGFFTTIQGYPPCTFARGWTHLAQTGAADDEVFFYNAEDGSGAVGRLDGDGLSVVREFPAGTFSRWTHIIGVSGRRPDAGPII